MTTVRLGAVSLDAADPRTVADFYRRLLDADAIFESEDFIALRTAGMHLTVQRVADHRPPEWPDGAIPKQLHLELAVDDLEGAEAKAVELGARKAPHQPSPDRWRVLFDPAGHPFCITTLIPST